MFLEIFAVNNVFAAHEQPQKAYFSSSTVRTADKGVECAASCVWYM